ncbi:hypothetical protein KEM60_02361 [Austwickia sp. TVS 96-490-7B]|uniref:septation protein SepH n=1 Tax=Austwickia sp. TVS 96-490-7B TaxID=2830843 RepID=UPI001C56B910|nr:septation protein SepH [Austwickia sp. TVS 96-490-7B]MBW3086150.1 hypothetical protein [Austwickia sp. TVS 96-490-7B]
MQDLHLIGVHEDGEFLFLVDGSGVEYRLRLDDAVRQAVRREARSMAGNGGADRSRTLGPREVQAMIRAGATAEEAAERAGWTVEKVHRYDGPILAEREYIAESAGRSRLRSRQGGAETTLSARVTERLTSRGVPADAVVWDSWRSEDGAWTVVAAFAAGGRARQASWSYSRQTGTVHALDDEALWLSADDDSESPYHASRVATRGRRTTPFGRSDSSEQQGRAFPSRLAVDESAVEDVARPMEVADASEGEWGPEGEDDGFELMDAVRHHSAAGRRGGPSRPAVSRRSPHLDVRHAGPADLSPTTVPPLDEPTPEDAVPLVDFGYDPEIMPPPPGAHSDPCPDDVDGRPEPAAAALARQEGPRRVRRNGPTPRPRRTSPSAEEGPAVEDTWQREESLPDGIHRGGLGGAAGRTVRRSGRDGRGHERGVEITTGENDDETVSTAPGTGDAEDSARRTVRSRAKGRASVPSWDDIMFGHRGRE